MRLRLSPGLQLSPHLRLLRVLGRGSMGEVWVAEDADLRAEVAVKFLAAGFLRDPAALGRFEREWKVASELDDPHAVRILGQGKTEHGEPYIVMELVHGESLEDRLDRTGPFSFEQAAVVLHAVGSALKAAHSLGIVHRDIKPENILLHGEGPKMKVKVLDFGLAKPWSDRSVTASGVLVGTPDYMSPEQILGGKHIDHRTDVWALAVVAYRMLCGDIPFREETLHALVFRICRGEYTPVPSDLPELLDAFFLQGLEPDKDKRFGSVRELLSAYDKMVRKLGSSGEEVTTTQRIKTQQERAVLEESPASTEPLTRDWERATDQGRARRASRSDTKTNPMGARHRKRSPKIERELSDSVTKLMPLRAETSSVETTSVETTSAEASSAVELPAVRPPSESIQPAVAGPPVSMEPPTVPLPPRSAAAGWGARLAVVAFGLAVGAGGFYIWRLREPPKPTSMVSGVSPVEPERTAASPQPPPAAEPAPTTQPTTTAEAAITAEAATSAKAAPSAKPSAAAEPSGEPPAVGGIGYLSIRCTPVCLIRVGNRALGTSPLKKQSLESGRYTIVLYRDDAGAKTIKIDLRAGQHAQYDVTMTRSGEIVGG